MSMTQKKNKKKTRQIIFVFSNLKKYLAFLAFDPWQDQGYT